ncbi:restriction endonuclease subunit S [Phascolarctobacterium succinatutens]|uniref:restriction endonuclease subunit S n=3 Tax=Phascolarctobacterium succinatutens TaxID=626940 RepID=UPI003079D509
MSNLEELIERLCPDGVEYKTLGDVATISRGGNFQKKDFTEQGKPCIHYGQIYTRYGLFTDNTLTFINDECFAKQKYAEPNDIIMAVTSENIEDICKCVAWLGTEKVAVSGHSAIIHHSLDPKYLAYFFHSQHFFNQKRRLAHGTKVMEVTPDTLKSIQLPVPPLEVQREIVRILDNFTFLTTELAAELAARQKQYEFYRDFLLNFNDGCEEEINGNVRLMKLGELGKWSGGKTPSMAEKSFWENGSIPWISSKDMKFNTLLDTQDHITQKALIEASMTLYPANSIAVVTRSGILKHTFPVAYIPFPTTINQDIKILVVNDEILPRYAFHVIQSKGKDILEKTKKQGGTVDSLDFQKVLAFKVLVPTKSIQQKLVDKLDRFDALCNDISSGLPAEIEMRQKQYEYYRDKLLTFKELKKEA